MPPAPNSPLAKQQSGDTVTVACKLPGGLILRLFDMVETSEPVMGGGSRTVNMARPLPDTVTIAGWSHPAERAPLVPIVGGYALTHGVSKDFFDRWMQENADSDVVRNGLIWAHGKADYAADKAKERRKERSGFEPLDPDNLPMKGVKTANTKEEA